MSEPVVVGGTYRWELAATRDLAAATMTAASICFYNQSLADGTRFSGTIDADGVAYYVNATTLFDQGDVNWTVSWRVTYAGGVVLETAAEPFKVHGSNYALTA